jgi:hypothetical protein
VSSDRKIGGGEVTRWDHSQGIGYVSVDVFGPFGGFLHRPTSGRRQRQAAFAAMIKKKKIDLAAIEAAYNGKVPSDVAA